MYTGYTKELTEEQKAVNEFNSCVGILANNPGCKFWQTRLIAAYEKLVAMNIVRDLTTYQQWQSAEKDAYENRSNKKFAMRWWLRVQAENGRSTSPYHF